MPAQLSSTARIAPGGEPGTPLVIEGVVRTAGGKPAPGIVVYAYHTDDTGIYPRAQNRHGRLRGWARADAEGRYRFDTIRPRAYPGRRIPEHVHMHVIEPGKGTYYIDEIRFEDDPLISAANRATEERGGKGLALPERAGTGWRVRRDIVLGQNIPGYR
jgi:protocatechuate 3,4-dioxygenase beta subunit